MAEPRTDERPRSVRRTAPVRAHLRRGRRHRGADRGERVFGIKTDRASHAEDLRAVLGGLKGPLMKVAQFLSTIPDALPAEYAAELAHLQANAPAMGWAFVRRRMAAELGAGLAIQVRLLRRDGRGRRQSRPGASRAPAGRHRCRLQAAISGHAEHGGGGSAPASHSRWRSIIAWTMRSSTRRSTRSWPSACARSSTTSVKPRTCGSTASCCGTARRARARPVEPLCTTAC